MRYEETTPSDRLVQRLKLLVFFHLGADATLDLIINPSGLKASISHSRTEPFDLILTSQELKDIADSPETVEELFLDLLVSNRLG